MRTKVIALVGACVLLAGCSAATPEAIPTVSESPTPTAEATLDFCDELEAQNADYNALMDTAPIHQADLKAFGEWADRLEAAAPTDVVTDLSDYVAPIRFAESTTADGSIDAVAWTQGHNGVNMYCVSNG